MRYNPLLSSYNQTHRNLWLQPRRLGDPKHILDRAVLPVLQILQRLFDTLQPAGLDLERMSPERPALQRLGEPRGHDEPQIPRIGSMCTVVGVVYGSDRSHRLGGRGDLRVRGHDQVDRPVLGYDRVQRLLTGLADPRV